MNESDTCAGDGDLFDGGGTLVLWTSGAGGTVPFCGRPHLLPGYVEVPYAVGANDHRWLIFSYEGFRAMDAHPSDPLEEETIYTRGIALQGDSVIVDRMEIDGRPLFAANAGGFILQQKDGLIAADWGPIRMGMEVRIRIRALGPPATGLIFIYGEGS